MLQSQCYIWVLTLLWLLQIIIVVVAISVDILVDIDFVTCKACRHSISVGRIERTLSLYN